MNASGIITDPVREMYARAILAAILIFMILVLSIVWKLTAKPKVPPAVVADMHESFSAEAKAHNQQLLREYYELTDKALFNGRLSDADQTRVNDVYFALRKVPCLDWKRPS